MGRTLEHLEKYVAVILQEENAELVLSVDVLVVIDHVVATVTRQAAGSVRATKGQALVGHHWRAAFLEWLVGYLQEALREKQDTNNTQQPGS